MSKNVTTKTTEGGKKLEVTVDFFLIRDTAHTHTFTKDGKLWRHDSGDCVFHTKQDCVYYACYITGEERILRSLKQFLDIYEDKE